MTDRRRLQLRMLTAAPVDAIGQARPPMRTLLAPPEWAGAVVFACRRERAGWPPVTALRAALSDSAALDLS